jgi:hypothetical protein
MTIALARFIMNDPFIMLGAAVGLILGEFIPLHQSVAEWTRQTIWNTVRTIVWLPPEVTVWQNLMFKAKNTLAGGFAGVLGKIITINILKILIGLAYEAQRRHNIPDIDGMRKLLMLTARATRLAVEAPKYAALSDQEKRDFKNEKRAIENQWKEVKQAIPALEAPQKQQPKGPTFPFPYSEQRPLLPLAGPKQTKAKASKSSSSGSESDALKSGFTTGSEAEDEMGDPTKRSTKNIKPSGAPQPQSKAKKGIFATTKKTGEGFIRGQTLKPIDERMQMGSAAPLPYVDFNNDSFLIKPKR